MVILGLLLLIIAVIAAITAIARGNVAVHIDLGWFTVKTDTGVVFFLGAAAMLAFVIGWWLLARGMRRGRERRREVKALRKRAVTSEETARREHEARVAEQGAPDDAGSKGQREEPPALNDTSRDR
jgi:membrane protein implicated in regulation of membrane protease activity